IREILTRAIAAPRVAMCEERRRAGAYENRTRIACTAAQWVAPRCGKAGERRIEKWIVEILITVAGELDDDHAFRGCVEDCIVIVGPPFQRQIAAHAGKARTRALQLDQNDVAGNQP